MVRFSNSTKMASIQSTSKDTKSKSKHQLKTKLTQKRRIIVLMWTLWFAYISLTAQVDSVSASSVVPVAGLRAADSRLKQSISLPIDREPKGSLHWLPSQRLTGADSGSVLRASLLDDYEYDESNDYDLVSGFNCTSPAILDFPPDLFDQTQRANGAIAVHFLASIYVFYVIALVCDDYFVPSIEAICGDLKIPTDVAGATFMAIATSAPELFTNIIGTFITQGDIGVGTIVGSAVFNILAVCACCGFAAKMALPLDWYPLTRDCLFYLLSVILLLVMLQDERIYLYEAVILVVVYIVYILVMWKNATLKRAANRLVSKFGYNPNARYSKGIPDMDYEAERTPLLGASEPLLQRVGEEQKNLDHYNRQDDFVSKEDYDEMLIAKALHKQQEDAEEEEAEFGVCSLPRGQSCGVWIEWLVGWPARLVLTLTIPDCRTNRFRKWYPLTFIMCIVYIAVLAYVVSWLMTVIGHTFKIPDSVMGLTFIAAGTSVPEAVSSIIVTRQGLGGMGISNSIGSNTFDILMCLGLPWLIRSAIIASSETNFIQINSTGLEYSTIMLLTSLVLFYAIIAFNKFYLNKTVACMALSMYCIFLVLASLFELNVFFLVNLPACEISDSI